jgi:hypothetical protein
MDKQQPLTQQEVNARIARHVPSHAWQSTVVLVAAKRPKAGQAATGVLFQVADARFVVTAGHVIRGAKGMHFALGLAATGSPSVVPLAGDWLVSDQGDNPPASDAYDVAALRLTNDVGDQLSAKQFLRTTDIQDDDPGPRAVYTLFGYPGLWSRQSSADAEDISSRPLEFTTYAHDGDVQGLQGYERRLHLLLSGDPEYITAIDGSNVEIRDRAGQLAAMPRALRGVSGCSVWHIGDLGVPIERWGERPAQVVGIETAIYPAAGVIKASRWTVVTTLIHSACPDLRPALRLWRT